MAMDEFEGRVKGDVVARDAHIGEWKIGGAHGDKFSIGGIGWEARGTSASDRCGVGKGHFDHDVFERGALGSRNK
jgi:hypothetical protein